MVEDELLTTVWVDSAEGEVDVSLVDVEESVGLLSEVLDEEEVSVIRLELEEDMLDELVLEVLIVPEVVCV